MPPLVGMIGASSPPPAPAPKEDSAESAGAGTADDEQRVAHAAALAALRAALRAEHTVAAKEAARAHAAGVEALRVELERSRAVINALQDELEARLPPAGAEGGSLFGRRPSGGPKAFADAAGAAIAVALVADGGDGQLSWEARALAVARAAKVRPTRTHRRAENRRE